jgi:hypothetical protein
MATQQELDELYNAFPSSKPTGLTGFAQNIFGAVPTYYEGLLGSAETQALQKRSTNQGLLGAAIGLLGGMGTRGTTAAQNIAGALSGGMQASQGAIQQGLTNYQMQQQLAQSKIAQDQAASLRADVAKVMQMPEVRNNPALIASLRADPAKTLAWINENMAVSQAYQPQVPQQAPQQQVPQQPGAVTSMVEPPPQAGMLPPVEVTATRSKAETEINRLLTANQRLTGLPGKTAQDAIKSNLDQIAALEKQLMKENVSNFDFNSIKGTVSPDLLSQVNNLQRLAETGQITAKDLQDGLKDIQKYDYEFKNSQRDYTKESVRIAGKMFPNVPFNSLNPQQLGELTDEMDKREIAKRRAGATNVSVSTGKAFGTEFGKGVAESVGNTFSAAQGAQSTLSAIQNIRPLIQSGVYAGPLSSVPRVVDQLATSLGITGKDDSERLKNTAVAMQGLASLELSAAQAMKGQGAITGPERDLIKRAAGGDLQTFTQPEVLSLLNALEKTSQFKIKAHEKNLGRLRNRPDTAELADFYSLDQQAPPAPAGARKYNSATGRIE